MRLIFLLFLPWNMSAMDIPELSKADLDEWLVRQLTQEQSTNAITNPTQATIITSASQSFSLNTSLSSNTGTHFMYVKTPGASPATSPITEHNFLSSSSDSHPIKRSRTSHHVGSREQQTRSSESVGQSQESEESSGRPRKFIVGCPLQPCVWHMIYNEPCDPETSHYLELMCVERIWRHCHTTHWSLQAINDYVSKEFKYPTPLEEEENS